MGVRSTPPPAGVPGGPPASQADAPGLHYSPFEEAVALGTPYCAIPPTITGSAKVGGTVQATQGTWGAAPTSYEYVWLRETGTSWFVFADGQEITLDETVANECIKVVVKATNAKGEGTEESLPVQVQ